MTKVNWMESNAKVLRSADSLTVAVEIRIFSSIPRKIWRGKPKPCWDASGQLLEIVYLFNPTNFTGGNLFTFLQSKDANLKTLILFTYASSC